MTFPHIGGGGRRPRMQRSLAALRQYEAQHPNGYTATQCCAALHWSRSWFQMVLREHRLISGQGTTNTPATPLHGGNRPHTYQSTNDVTLLDAGKARFVLVAIAYLGLVRAFAQTMQNIATLAGNAPMARTWRRNARYLTFVMEELRDLRDAS